MSTTKTWHVDLFIGERDGLTHAEARLRPDETVTLTGTGTARLNPTDRDVPEIGDELAVARALSTSPIGCSTRPRRTSSRSPTSACTSPADPVGSC